MFVVHMCNACIMYSIIKCFDHEAENFVLLYEQCRPKENTVMYRKSALDRSVNL